LRIFHIPYIARSVSENCHPDTVVRSDTGEGPISYMQLASRIILPALLQFARKHYADVKQMLYYLIE